MTILNQTLQTWNPAIMHKPHLTNRRSFPHSLTNQLIDLMGPTNQGTDRLLLLGRRMDNSWSQYTRLAYCYFPFCFALAAVCVTEILMCWSKFRRSHHEKWRQIWCYSNYLCQSFSNVQKFYLKSQILSCSLLNEMDTLGINERPWIPFVLFEL